MENKWYIRFTKTERWSELTHTNEGCIYIDLGSELSVWKHKKDKATNKVMVLKPDFCFSFTKVKGWHIV
jgi:hypothetical protein